LPNNTTTETNDLNEETTNNNFNWFITSNN
jgi:hypothetical protein